MRAINGLEGNDYFPLALVPHLILFFTGEKQAIRFVLKKQVSDQFRTCLEAMGYCGAESRISITQVGDNWGQIDAIGDVRGGASDTHRLLVMAEDRATCGHVLELELSGDSADVGRLLGYPPCCVDAYADLAATAKAWPDALIAKSPHPLNVSLWCNRLASLWGGTCPTGELFPCSLQCPNAIRYGQRSDVLLRQHGFAPLAAEIRRQASHPIYLLNGEVVTHGEGLADAVRIPING